MCAFEGEALRTAVHRDDEVETESELVGKDLAVFRDRGVGILEVVRGNAGLETGLVSRGRLVATVVALREGNDN